MGHKLRLIEKNMCYHVYTRGSRQLPTFQNQDDYLLFFDLLIKYAAKYNIIVNAFCFMKNHIHLVIYTLEKNLDKFMMILLGTYSRIFNNKYNLKGHLWEDRYKYKKINLNDYFFNCINYIHLNPVKAGIINKAYLYEWSSCKFYSGLTKPLKEFNFDMRKFLMFFESPKKNIFEIYKNYIETLDFNEVEEIFKLYRDLEDEYNLEDRRLENNFTYNNRRFSDKYYENIISAKKIKEQVEYFIEKNYKIKFEKKSRLFRIKLINIIGYFLIELTNLSYNQIGQIIGINDRRLVYNIKQRFNKKRKIDSDFNIFLLNIKNFLNDKK